MMFGLKEKTLIPVNEDARVAAAREHTRQVMAQVAEAEAEEQRLRDVLNPPQESARTQPREITDDLLREANRRLIPRRFGVTDPHFADTREGIAARHALRAAQAEEASIRDTVQRELIAAVKERTGRIAREFEASLAPCRDLALELLSLQEQSGVNVPCVHSCLPYSNAANELHALREWAKAS